MEKIVQINIEEIMKQIREDISEKGYTNDILSFNDTLSFSDNSDSQFDKVVLNREVLTANQIWNVQAYRNLQCSGVKAFAKKAIRKNIKFYVEPIVNDQNNFNATVVRSLNSISTFIDSNNATIERMDNLDFKFEHGLKHDYKKQCETIQNFEKKAKSLLDENKQLADICKNQSQIIEKMNQQIELLNLKIELIEKKVEKIGG